MAPFGDIGTVIGLPYTGLEKKVDVLFDKPYFGGKVMRFVSLHCLISIT